MRMFYRLRQLWESLHARPTAPDLALAQGVLAPPLMALFLRLQPSEQAHSLRILCLLLEQGENHPDLLAAALLHDVGKSRYPLYVWERVVIVLGKAVLPKQARRWGQAQPRGWQRPFVIAEQHPVWGAEMAGQAGASPLTVSLIRNHQEAPPPLVYRAEPPQIENLLLHRLQGLDDES
jgi:putative nucleotidyltransferase with HDIG domain